MSTSDSDGSAHPEAPNLTTLYEVAVDTRQFEIDMFWRRSNYFLVLNAAVATAYFAIGKMACPFSSAFPVFLSIIGIIVSILWLRVSLGGKYWQSRWEEVAALLEEEFKPKVKLFSAPAEEVHQIVKDSLAKGDHGCLSLYIDRKVLKKPSVSLQMIYLAYAFIGFWGLCFLMALIAPFKTQILEAIINFLQSTL